MSQDGSIDLAAKDTTIDRNIISAKESGLGVAFKDNLPEFNGSLYERHVQASRKKNKELEDKQRAEEARLRQALERELAIQQQIIRDTAAAKARRLKLEQQHKVEAEKEALIEAAPLKRTPRAPVNPTLMMKCSTSFVKIFPTKY